MATRNWGRREKLEDPGFTVLWTALGLILLLSLFGLSVVAFDTGWQDPCQTAGTFDSEVEEAFQDTVPPEDFNAANAKHGQVQQYWGYGFNLSEGMAIEGIEVRLDAWSKGMRDSNFQYLCVGLSWDGGASWTSTYYCTGTIPENKENEATYILGGPSDTWSHQWTPSQLSDTSFRIRISAYEDGDRIELDWCPVRVYYSTITYTLTFQVSPGGAGTTSPAVGTHTYNYGDVVPIEATPATGWQFDHWEGDVTGSTNPDTVTMDGDKSVTAVFTKIPVTLTMEVSPTWAGATAPAAGTHSYEYGDVVPVEATSATGWQFDHWEGDVSGSSNPDTVTMDGDKSVTAVFTKIAVTLTMAISPSGAGTTSPAVGTHTYDFGNVVPIEATPATGWQFDHWEGDVSGSANPDTVTMDGDRSVTAVFTKIAVTLTMAVSPSGAGTTTPMVGTHTYDYGDVPSIEAMPTTGWQFDHWEGDLSGSANPTSITMTSEKTVRAVFFAMEPSIGIVKEASATSARMGDTITYTYVVTNTGNVTLIEVSAADDVLGAIPLGATTLGPGVSTSGTLSHTVQESDLPGPLVNLATATGTPPAGAAVSEKSIAVRVSLVTNPAIDLLIEASATEAYVGDAITYSYTVINTGDVTLTDIEVNDDLLGSISLQTSRLGPKESTAGKGVYVVRESDPPWPIVDVATVVAVSPTGERVTDDSAPVIVNLFPSGEPAIEVTKTADPTTARVNDEITYIYTVTNTGNVPLMDVSLTDELLGVTGLAASTLAPAESTTATAVDTVMESDLPGPLKTIATATASDAFGRIAADQASATLTLEAEVADSEWTSEGEIAGRGEIIVSSYDGKVIISEVAWAGTAVDPWGEWIELRNLGTTSVDLTDWTLRWRRKHPSTPDEHRWKVVGLSGMLMPSTTPLAELDGHESIPSVSVVKNDRDDISWLVLYESKEKDDCHYFLERWHDATVSNVTADLVYDTAPPYELELSDLGDVILLVNGQGKIVDTANAFESELDGWPAGDATILASMERTDPLGPDAAENWHTNQGIITHGFDALGRPLVASAGVPNPMLLDENSLFADLPVTEHRVGEQLKVGLQLPKAGRNVPAGPWIYAASDLGEVTGVGGTVENDPAQASSIRETDDTYWLAIDTSDLLPGRYDFWVGTGVGKAVIVPIVILP